MKEIKFRVFDNKNKSMFSSCEEPYFETNGCFYIIPVKGGLGGSDDFKLMQYIGKKDKNGKEIYEKDIIIAPFNDLSNYGVIEFTECRFWLRSNLCKSLYDLYDFNSEDLEIIGNVFENPDLVDGWFK